MEERKCSLESMVEDLIITNRSINESNDNSISNVIESTDNFDYYEDEE